MSGSVTFSLASEGLYAVLSQTEAYVLTENCCGHAIKVHSAESLITV